MPKLGRTTPCAVCPWRTRSPRGYVGADEPVHFYWQSITHENPMPCHEQIDYSDPEWQTTQLPDADLCAGGLIHFRNICKAPRDPQMYAAYRAVKPSKAVFGWHTDWFRHHLPLASKNTIMAAMHKALTRYVREWVEE